MFLSIANVINSLLGHTWFFNTLFVVGVATSIVMAIRARWNR